jgi:CBS domain-containing protein
MSAPAYSSAIPEGLRPAYTVPRDVHAHDVVRFMAARGTRAVVVLRGMKPVGMVTARDLAERVSGSGLSDTMERVESAMSSPLVKIGEWGSVVEAIAMMNHKGIGHLPIVSANGYLLSVITLEDAQHLRARGVTALDEFVRTSVVVPMGRRNAWTRTVYAIRRGVRENRLWWLMALGLAVAGAVLALAIGQSWLGFQTYQPRDYEPKDLPRQQYEEQKRQTRQPDFNPRAR